MVGIGLGFNLVMAKGTMLPLYQSTMPSLYRRKTTREPPRFTKLHDPNLPSRVQ